MDNKDNNYEKKEKVIYLGPIIASVKKHLAIILAVAVVLGIGSYVYSRFFITPIYRTSFSIYVNNRSEINQKADSLTNQDVYASKSLANTYANILTTRKVLVTAAKEIGEDFSYKQLTDMVSTQVMNDTEIITVYVKSESPELCQKLAQSIIDVASVEISSMIEGSSMSVIDDPYLPVNIYYPSPIKNAVMFFIIGAIVTLIIIIITAFFDNRIKREDEVEERFGISKLGVVPNIHNAKRIKDKYYYYESRGVGNAEK